MSSLERSLDQTSIKLAEGSDFATTRLDRCGDRGDHGDHGDGASARKTRYDLLSRAIQLSTPKARQLMREMSESHTLQGSTRSYGRLVEVSGEQLARSTIKRLTALSAACAAS